MEEQVHVIAGRLLRDNIGEEEIALVSELAESRIELLGDELIEPPQSGLTKPGLREYRFQLMP